MAEKDCTAKDKLIREIPCDIQMKIDMVKAEILSNNPYRGKVSDKEAILKMINAYPLKK